MGRWVLGHLLWLPPQSIATVMEGLEAQGTRVPPTAIPRAISPLSSPPVCWTGTSGHAGHSPLLSDTSPTPTWLVVNEQQSSLGRNFQLSEEFTGR